jgi:hypothetical protein
VKTYRSVVNYLKRACPPNVSVSVRRLKLSEHFDGDCQLKNGMFLIRINRNLPEHEAIDVLIHEWAHTLSWDLCPIDEHCDEWGKAYSRVYRAFLREFLDMAC